MKGQLLIITAVTVLVVVGGVLPGCRDAWPHSAVWVPGDLGRTHGEPAEGGYYSDWDPFAKEVTVEPALDVNPVMTQHVLIATVMNEEGVPLPNRRVEWMLAEGSVGSFVEVDESGWRRSRGHKLDNKFAITHTNNFDHLLTRGNDDPADDIQLEKGQTWIVLTSPTEGTSHVVAYVPGIYDWDKHKVFVTKHWYDVAWRWPPEATNRVGTDHVLVTKVMKYSDGTPLEGYHVTYKIADGPAGVLSPGGGQTATVKTDADGMASVTLTQQAPAEGTNQIEIQIVRPENIQCCEPAAHIATGTTTKTWVAPKIAISKIAPERATVGETFRYVITVTSPGDVRADDVVVTDLLPDGIQYVSSSPAASVSGQRLAWNFGSLEAGGTMAIHVDVRGLRTGTFTNCAEVSADGGLSDRACDDTLITEPRIELMKEGPDEVILCDTINYKITVRNTGDAPATNVQFVDELPAGLRTLDDRASLTFNVGTLQPGEARLGEVQAKAQRTGTYTNSARASADGGLQATASATTIVRSPVLEVSKTGPSERFLNRPAQYTITVRNTGDAPARDTVLTDTLPVGTTMVEATEGAVQSGGTVQWNLGTISAGGQRSVMITLTPTQAGTLTNRVTARAYCAEASDEVTTMVRGIPAILLEAIDLEDPIEIGEQETYVITVTNQGSADDTNVRLVCMLPEQLEYVSATGPSEARLDGNEVVFAPVPQLPPKEKVTYRVNVRGVGTGDVRFHVHLTSDQIREPVEETESTNIYR